MMKIKQKEPKALKAYRIAVSQTLSKSVSVMTDNYEIAKKCNENGEYSYIDNTDNTNWKEVFEREYWDIASLLNVLKEYIKQDMLYHTTKRGQKQLDALLASCEGWCEDEYVVIKE